MYALPLTSVPKPLMKERRKIIAAGPIWIGVQYRAALSRDPNAARQAKMQITRPVQEALNARRSFQKLMLQIACNFRPTDSVVTVTYRDADLPKSKAEADKHLTAFIRKYRTECRARGAQSFPYIRVTEGYTSDHRYHHHVILPRCHADPAEIRMAWARYGDNIDVRPLSWGPPDRYDEQGRPSSRRPKALPDNCYFSWAKYLSKESIELGRRRVGERMWRASLGLQKPTVLYANVSESDTLTPPPGAFVLDRSESVNEYGRFLQITAIIQPPSTK